MSNFQSTQFQVVEDQDSIGPRVVKTAPEEERSVQEFKFNDLKQAHKDPRDRSSGMAKQEQRFILSQLTRDALSIGKEEERVIEERVAKRLDDMSEVTRVKAHEIGYTDGLKAGREEAYQAFRAESTERIERLNQLIQSMEGAKSQLFEAEHEFLMNVVYRVAKVVLLRELSTDREYLLRLSRELIERCGQRENLILKIHPSDIESIEMLKQGLLQSFSSLKNIAFEVSDQVAQGGCVLETEWGAIDASIETQLAQILKNLDVPQGTTP